MTAVVVGQDAVTPLGRGVDACWEALLDGTSGISPLTRFPSNHVDEPWAATVPGLDYHGGVSLTWQLLEPLLATWAPRVPDDATIVLASINGEVDLLERHVLDERGAVADSSLTTLLAKIQARLGNDGGGLVVSAACASGSVALGQAAALIDDGEADAVLVVACDTVTEFVFSGFASLHALSSGRATPFDRGRDGLSVGEAAGLMLLMSQERAEREERPILAAVAGWGGSNDANHMTGPSRKGSGLRLAIERALAMAGVAPGALAAVSAHGTGTVYNDAMEIAAFRTALGDAPPPTFAVKGAVGHSMGAAGLLEAILSVHALGQGVVPGTIGCREVEADAEGWISPDPRPIAGGAILSTNSGFGGINAALVLAPHGVGATE